MFRKTYEVIGNPNVTINSLKQTYNCGTVFTLHSSQITKEIEDLVKMGLLKELKKTMLGLAKEFFKPKASVESVQSVAAKVDNNQQQIAGMLKEMEKNILSKIDQKLKDSPTTQISPLLGLPHMPEKKTNAVSKPQVVIEDDVEDLNTGVIYISPDKKDLTASKEVETSVSDDNLDDAVNKLKGKKGPKKNG